MLENRRGDFLTHTVEGCSLQADSQSKSVDDRLTLSQNQLVVVVVAAAAATNDVDNALKLTV